MDSKRIGLALIGIGRAGTIHFNNSLASRRAEVRYIVDYDVSKCNKFIETNFLESTKTLSPDHLAIALGIY